MYLLQVDIYDRITICSTYIVDHPCFLISCFSESFLSEIPEKASESFLSEVFCRKFSMRKFSTLNYFIFRIPREPKKVKSSNEQMHERGKQQNREQWRYLSHIYQMK